MKHSSRYMKAMERAHEIARLRHNHSDHSDDQMPVFGSPDAYRDHHNKLEQDEEAASRQKARVS
jgi:hypothetical protein